MTDNTKTAIWARGRDSSLFCAEIFKFVVKRVYTFTPGERARTSGYLDASPRMVRWSGRSQR